MTSLATGTKKGAARKYPHDMGDTLRFFNYTVIIFPCQSKFDRGIFISSGKDYTMKLQVTTNNGIEVLDSREVAQSIRRQFNSLTLTEHLIAGSTPDGHKVDGCLSMTF